MAKGDFKLTPAREKELEKLAKDLPDSDFKKRYGKDWKSVKIATAMNILKKKYNFKEDKMNFKEIREKYRSKFPSNLVSAAVKIALDMGGNMTGAYKKIEKMKKGLANDPAVKGALQLANEAFEPRALNSLGAKNYSMTFTKAQPKSLAKFLSMIKGQEKFGAGIKVKNVKKGVKGSTIVNFTSGSNLQITALQNALNKIMDQFNESFSNTQESLAALEEKVITFGYTFFDTKSLNSFMKKALKLKGLTIIDSDKKAGGHFVVKVQGEKNVVAQANSLAIQAQSESVKKLEATSQNESVEVVTEAYSKNLTDKDVDAQFKSMRDPESFYGDLDTARADMKKDYSPKNSARPKVWTALSYPVRDGDYYFAFIDKNQKNNMKYNEKMNDALKVALKGGDKKSVDDMWSVVSRELRTYPKSLGWNDTMTREELYGAIQHMLGKISESNIIEKSLKTKAGIMVGKRSKAPKYESTGITEAVKTVGPKWQIAKKVFPITPNQWKKEWKDKYNVEFIKVEKKRIFKGQPDQTFVYVKGEEKDLANWFMQVYSKLPGMNVPLFKSMPKTLAMVKDADDGRNFGLTKESNDVQEGFKLSDEMIRRKFPNVWAASAKEPKVLDMFHKSVNTANMNVKTKAYQKLTIGKFIRDELNGGYLDREIIKKLNLKASNDFSALRGKLNNVKEANFEFVDMDKKTREIVVKLAKKHGLKVKERKKGNLSNLDLEGPNNKMGKFMEQLPPEALE